MLIAPAWPLPSGFRGKGCNSQKSCIMHNSPVFSVIIPVFNKWELTEACLRSLREHSAGCAYELIVVDNASDDNTRHALLPLGEGLFGTAFSRIRFEENRNFGPACNAAAQVASSPLLFFLNNDTLLTPAWAPPLLESLSADPSLGGVGPLLLYADHTVQHCGMVFSPRGTTAHLYRYFPADHPVVQKTRRFQAITAAALMMPKALFLEHGGFYEAYRNGFEDVDLCLRMGQNGKYFTCNPASRIFHLESQSPGRELHTGYNAEIFRQRCGKLFRPDMHRHGLKDAFCIFINDALDIGLRLCPKEAAALLKAAVGQPVSVWLQYCQEHPYWVEGHEHCVRILEEQGNAADALELQQYIADLLRSTESFEKLAQAADRLGDTDTRNRANTNAAMLAARGRDMRNLCRRLLQRCEQWQERKLAALYEEKLRNMR
jgi:GT2 family glycosyltransferase